MENEGGRLRPSCTSILASNKAASVAYKSVMRAYPESPIPINTAYGGKIPLLLRPRKWHDKQEERYAGTLTAYHELVDGYPKSSYLRNAEKYYTLADNHIKKLT